MAVPQQARNFMTHGKTMALATASSNGEPNVAPMQQCWWFDDHTLVIGDFFMNITKANIQANGRASFTVWDENTRESYKFTGRAKYVTSGPEYDLANGEMKKSKPDKDFKGVVVVGVEQVCDMKPGPTAGQILTA